MNNKTDSNTKPIASRRKFIQKASVGAALVSIPAKSVWATGGGILNSIVASGHGSDWAQGEVIKLKHVKYFINQIDKYTDFKKQNFEKTFGLRANKDDGSQYNENAHFKAILNNTNRNAPSLEAKMVTLYLNAALSSPIGMSDGKIYYPIEASFGNISAYADYLGKMALYDSFRLENTLDHLLDNFS